MIFQYLRRLLGLERPIPKTSAEKQQTAATTQESFHQVAPAESIKWEAKVAARLVISYDGGDGEVTRREVTIRKLIGIKTGAEIAIGRLGAYCHTSKGP